VALARDDRSLLADWWWTASHQLIAAVYALLTTGFVLSLAASPAVAARKGLDPYHFFERHAFFAVAGAVLVFVISLMRPVDVRRTSLCIAVAGLAGLLAVLLVGPEINGAQRWLAIGSQQLQPSEIFKPAFVVMIAWLLSRSVNGSNVSALALAAGLLVIATVLLALEPDIGQAILLTLVWICLFFLSGQPLRWMVAIAAAAVVLSVVVYRLFENVDSRIHRLLHTSSGDS
jgi:cell division protein FtsW